MTDPTTVPFWEAAERRELLIQRCTECGAHQFYPRPFCLECNALEVEWVTAGGGGTVYSMTVVHLPVSKEFEPPYAVLLVDLDEGPRLLGNLLEGECAIGDRVRVAWRERVDGPPVPAFVRD